MSIEIDEEEMNTMKKMIVVATMAVLATAVTALALGGKSGDGNATGKITELKVSSPTASVQGIPRKGALWLAYTVRWEDGRTADYKPIKVKGKFSKTLTFALRPQGLREVIVCLWRYKVSEKRCAKDRKGTACQYCRKNGFHMEGRQDRRTGS